MTDLLDLPALSNAASNNELYVVDPAGAGSDHRISVATLFGDIPVAPVVKPSALGTMIEFDATEGNADALPFRYTTSSGNNATSRDNIVHRWGINIDANGTGLQADASEPVVSFEIEEIFETGSDNLVEAHWVAIDTDATLRRPITWSFDRGNIDTTLAMALSGQSFSFNQADQTQRVKFDFDANNVVWTNVNQSYATNNNHIIQQQRSDAAGYVSLIRLNSDDDIELGGSGTFGTIRLRGNVHLNASPVFEVDGAGETVTFGEASKRSGGLVVEATQTMLTMKNGSQNYSLRASGGGFFVNDDNTGNLPFLIQNNCPSQMLVLNAGGRIDLMDQVYIADEDVVLGTTTGTKFGTSTTQKLGFFNSTPVVQPTVSGARNDTEAALASLLTALDTLGLINDTTTAS